MCAFSRALSRLTLQKCMWLLPEETKRIHRYIWTCSLTVLNVKSTRCLLPGCAALVHLSACCSNQPLERSGARLWLEKVCERTDFWEDQQCRPRISRRTGYSRTGLWDSGGKVYHKAEGFDLGPLLSDRCDKMVSSRARWSSFIQVPADKKKKKLLHCNKL